MLRGQSLADIIGNSDPKRRLKAAYASMALELENQQANSFLWLPVFFAIGIALYFSVTIEPPLILGIILWLFFGSLLVTINREKHSKTYLCLTILLIAWSGFTASQLRTSSVHTPMLDRDITYADLTGTVSRIEKLEGKKGSRIVLSNLNIEKISDDKTPRTVRLQLRKDENIRVGQTVKVLASLHPPSGAVYPGGYNFRRALYFQGIGAVGFIYSKPEIIEPASPSILNIELLRHEISQKVWAALPPEQAALVTALTIGQRKGMTEENQDAIRDAGLAHLLAISGLHVGLFSGFLFFFIRLGLASFPHIALKYPIKNIAAVCALLGAVFYMLLAGATIPTQRAVLMTGAVFLAIILNRSPISLRLVSFAALFILIMAPESLISASFQLSFAAVTALVAFYDITRQFWIDAYRQATWQKKVALYFLGVCISSIIASLATGIFALYHFQQFAVMGLLANLIAIPLMAFVIMPASVLSLIAMPFGLETLPLFIMGQGVTWVLEISHWAAALPGATLNTAGWPFSSFICFVLAGLLLVLWTGRGKYVAIPITCIGIALIYMNTLPDILVSDSSKLTAFKTDKNLAYVNTKRSEKFVLENWEKYLGLEEGQSKKLPKQETISKDIRCDGQGCYLHIKGKKIAFSQKPYAHEQDCAWADILIAEDPVKQKCNAKIIIDKFDTWAHGAHAVWLQDLRVETTRTQTGKRPWSSGRAD